MRTILKIIVMILLVITLNYIIAEEPAKILIDNNIAAMIDNNTLYVELPAYKNTDISRTIHWILTILEPHWNNSNIYFKTENGNYYIDVVTIKKYYTIQLMDRAGAIDLESMQVE